MGLRLSEQKTKITHIDDGLDLLGWRIRRHPKRGTNRQYVYTYPARRAVHAVTGKPTRDGRAQGAVAHSILVAAYWMLNATSPTTTWAPIGTADATTKPIPDG
jgi:RNA-directed DNA polymerase